jgi:pilus assembly protein CpaC
MKLVTFILIVAVSWPGAIYAQTPEAAVPQAPESARLLDAETAPLPIVIEAVALPQAARAVVLPHTIDIVAPPPAPPAAALPPAAGSAVTGTGATAIEIVSGQSTVVDVGTAITRVSLSSPEVADALVTSSSQLLLHGKAPGTMSMFVWSNGSTITRYEVAVQRDVTRLAEQLRTLFPRESIAVRGSAKHVVISGPVSTKDVADKIVEVAGGFVEKKDEVISVMQVQPPRPTNQVLLRVRFAEVSRSALTEFGMSLFTGPTGVNNTLGRVTTGQFSAPTFSDMKWSKESGEFGADVTSAEGKFDFSDFLNFFLFSQRYDLGVVIRAMQQRGLFQSLAEPNLVAESGKEASFLAGGEFPIPVVQGNGANSAVSVQFKEFGIRLNFTPTVVENRVRLKVRPEVSTLDFGNAVVMNGFRIPALSTRRTETELELLDGQTFAIAGLINNRMSSTMQKVPGIGDIPILGHLFRSRAAQKDQTELVVMITPMILNTDSPGVTSELPRLEQPYLPRVEPNPKATLPEPAFQTPKR